MIGYKNFVFVPNYYRGSLPTNVLLPPCYCICCVYRDWTLNFHDIHQWCEGNPQAILPSRNQQQFSANVRAGVVSWNLIRSVFPYLKLTGEVNADFFKNRQPDLLSDFPLDIVRSMCHLHAGSHFGQAARQNPDAIFRPKWIGRGGSTAWPVHSPNLNSLDFYLLGHLKALVYTTSIASVDVIHARIQESC